MFDGDFKKQKMTEEEYRSAFHQRRRGLREDLALLIAEAEEVEEVAVACGGRSGRGPDPRDVPPGGRARGLLLGADQQNPGRTW